MALVTVIIPNYNHAVYLKQRIESVLHQTYKNVEIIILDDCSTDNSRDIIETYRKNSKVKIVYNEINSGSPFHQWSKGIELAKGEYIWIAESDDWSELDFLSSIMGYANQFPEATLLYTDSYIHNNGQRTLMGPNIEGSYKYFETNELIKERLLDGISIYNGSAVVFKRAHALEHLKTLNTFKKHGDYFFWIVISLNQSAIFINRPLNHFRYLVNSVTNLSKKSLLTLEEHFSIFQLLLKFPIDLEPKKKKFFYNCWALRFTKIIMEVDNIIDKQYWVSKLIKSSHYNPYFVMKLFYHQLKS